jgi:hypothetical protein
MLITRAPLSTAQRIAFASASTGIDAADEGLGVEDLAREVRVARIDAGVDDRDGDRLERRERDPRGVEARGREVPLLRHERVVRRVRELPADEGLDVADAANSP